MRKDKKLRVLIIIVLTISVLGLTLGFAAFSNTLTISSSATVSPNASDFKIVVYGLEGDYTNLEDWFYAPGLDDYITFHDTYSVPALFNGAKASNAIIDNDALTLDLSSMNFVGTGDEIQYYFKIANEGKYDAYFGYNEYGELASTLTNSKVCIAEDGTSQDMVTNACGSVSVFLKATDGETEIFSPGAIDQYLKIPVGGFIRLYVIVDYRGEDIADGNWRIEFPEVKLNFTTVNSADN